MSTLDEKVRALLRPQILALTAYRVADPTGYVKLDAMENPYDWPKEMVDEWLEKLKQAKPNRYPDPQAARLKAVIRARHRVPAEASLLLGNGSDELIQIILMAVAGQGAVVAAPEPTFVMYRQIAATLGMQFVGVPLHSKDFELDMTVWRDALQRHRPAVIFLAYPNNPTGNLFQLEAMLEILEGAPGLVVVDEAYAPFAEATFMERLAEHEHLLIMRTVSKLGLAGLRLGYLAGAPAWIEQLDKVRLPYNINILTQISAEFALSKQAVFEAQTRQICRDRALLLTALQSLKGVQAFPSRANFILFRVKNQPVDAVHSALKKAGILIKNLHATEGALSNCLRVTVGTSDENQKFLLALKEILTAD